MLVELFILVSYIAGTGFGFYLGLDKGRKQGIALCIDNLIDQGYLKSRGPKTNPEIIKYDEK